MILLIIESLTVISVTFSSKWINFQEDFTRRADANASPTSSVDPFIAFGFGE